MDLGIKGRIALVAASSKGLGKATAFALAAEGVRVVMCARGEEALAAAAEEIRRETGAEVHAVPVDVAEDADIGRLFKIAGERFGGVDILVINAGGPPALPLDQLTDEQWLQAYKLTHLSAVRMVRHALPHMRQQRWGRIIAIESSSVKQPVAGLHLSNAIRPGVAGYFKSLVDEFAKENVTFNLVLPGVFLTDRVINNQRSVAEKTGTTLEARLDILKKNIPSGRFGEPREIGDMIAFLASERAAFVTGSVVQVDGGMIRSVV